MRLKWFNKTEEIKKNTQQKIKRKIASHKSKKIASFVTIHVEFKFFVGMFKQYNGKWDKRASFQTLLKSMCVVDGRLNICFGNQFFGGCILLLVYVWAASVFPKCLHNST